MFLEEARGHLLLDADAPIAVRCPVRMIHGLADESIPWETSLDVARRLASKDVSLELVPGADHRLSGPSDIKRMLARVEEVSLSVLR
jgi:dipeptidyl aminopeptidase/acylaminoacyl peptidase